MKRGAIAIFVAALAVDLGTKWLILHVVQVSPRVIEMLPFFNIVLVFNTGISFGLFRDFFANQPLLLAIVKTIIVLALVVWALRSKNRRDMYGAAMIAGGAAGNILDRIHNGAVTDFLDFHWDGWHFWSFNMGDVAVTLGVCCILLESIFPQRPHPHNGPA